MQAYQSNTCEIMLYFYICSSFGEKIEFLLKACRELSDFLAKSLPAKYPIEITPNAPMETLFRKFLLVIFIPLILPNLNSYCCLHNPNPIIRVPNEWLQAQFNPAN